MLDRYGLISNYVISHNALSFTKENFKRVKQLWKKEIENTVRHKFRSTSDVTISLFRDYQLETGRFSTRSTKFSKYFSLNEADDVARELFQQKHSLLCVNDAVTKNYEDNVKVLQDTLEKKFSCKSKFEK